MVSVGQTENKRYTGITNRQRNSNGNGTRGTVGKSTVKRVDSERATRGNTSTNNGKGSTAERRNRGHSKAAPALFLYGLFANVINALKRAVFARIWRYSLRVGVVYCRRLIPPLFRRFPPSWNTAHTDQRGGGSFAVPCS